MADATAIYALGSVYKEGGSYGTKYYDNKNASHESHDAPRQIRMKELEFLDKIGRGATSVVFAVNLNNRLAAAKKVNEVDRTEIALTKHFCHPNIVHLFGVVEEGPNAFIIMELASNGSLDKYLESSEDELPEELSLGWIKQSAASVSYLHGQGIVHRDIKSPNFLITGEKTLKLCDFGLARHLDATITTTTRGSLPWMAPEVMTEHKVSKPGDIYALATVIWEISTRKVPYEGLDFLQIQTQVVSKGKRPDIPDGLSRHTTNLLKQCWMADRNKRPLIVEVQSLIKRMEFEVANNSYRTRTTSSEPTSGSAIMEFGYDELHGARGVTCFNEYAVAVASRENNSVNVYDCTTGSKMFGLGEEENLELHKPYDVTVTSEQTFLVIEHSGSIIEFSHQGKFRRKINHNGSCKPYLSIATDCNGRVVMGAGNTLSMLSLKSSIVSIQQVDIKPHYIDVCGKKNEIVISGDSCLQIVDLCTGKVKLKRPVAMTAGVCYTKDSRYLHVVKRLKPYGPGVVDRHDAMSGAFITREFEGLERPGGAALFSSGTLAVADWSSVKTFKS